MNSNCNYYAFNSQNPNQNNNNFYNQEDINFDQIDGAENIYSSKVDEVHEETLINMRLGFVRKVYGILTVQLLLTTICCALAMFCNGVQNFMINNIVLLVLMVILISVLPFVIICAPSLMRQVPINYIVLFLFTIAESYLVAFICSFTSPRIVLMAAIMTFAMVSALTLYAVTTKTDITVQGGLFFILGMALFLFIIFGFFTQNKTFHIIIALLGVILFSLYIIYDTQLILGNKKEMIDMDDYILGAFCLYTDIIYIFLKILEILRYFSE